MKSAGKIRKIYTDGAGPSVHQPEAVDSLRFTPKEWDEILVLIERGTKAELESEQRRKHDRTRGMGLMQVVVELNDPGGTSAAIVARGHNMSPGGIGIIHGRYVYPGTVCTCWLRHTSKGMTPIQGTVRWCRHLQGMVHLSGVEFNEVIEVSDYIAE